ncbi:MAG: PHP domain-containing protein [bacterium]|nr:PHP domain-containing protein [bacterium]
MAVDLHLHSNLSDGSDEPEAIVRKAADIGLTTIALMDHDNLDGIDRARAAAEPLGLDVISGTELSVGWNGDGMHLLVYFLEPVRGPLQDRLAEVQEGRSNRNLRIVDRLNELGMDVTFEEVAEQADGTGIGRPHFAAVLVRKGYAADIKDAFDRYLASGRSAYLPRTRLGALEVIELARQSGAVSSIAHPHTLGVARADYRHAFIELTEAGLGGIEAYYSEYSQELREHLADLCQDLGLAATGGSDYHGTYKPDLQIGIGRGDLVVPDGAIDDLIAQRK